MVERRHCRANVFQSVQCGGRPCPQLPSGKKEQGRENVSQKIQQFLAQVNGGFLLLDWNGILFVFGKKSTRGLSNFLAHHGFVKIFSVIQGRIILYVRGDLHAIIVHGPLGNASDLQTFTSEDDLL
eukprot:scaffold31847_cov76-Amphora_coffeaeformis.AAC.1